MKVKCSIVGCRRKISLVQQIKGECRCGLFFCCKHNKNHDCKWDYLSENKKKLIKSNPHVSSEKVKKI